jgi:hypothetical protein
MLLHVSQRVGAPGGSPGAKSAGFTAEPLIFVHPAGMASRGNFCFCPGIEFEDFWVVPQKRWLFSLARENEASNSAGGIIL